MFGLLNELAGERGVVYQSRLSGRPSSWAINHYHAPLYIFYIKSLRKYTGPRLTLRPWLGGPKSPLAVKYGYSPAAAAAAEGFISQGRHCHLEGKKRQQRNSKISVQIPKE